MRDALMGRTPNDWDMTTDASPEEMLRIFDAANLHTIPTGLKHGTVSVLLNGEIYECTTFRIDGSYTDSRHPDKVTFTGDVTEDLRRRDFTVNAIAGDPLKSEGELIDVFGGQEDIDRKVIRAVGDPEKRFTEDALRILRAIRFATVLDFAIEKNTLEAAVKLGNRLNSVSAERKSVELQKILLSPHADRGIALLIQADLARYIHPDLQAPTVRLSTLPVSFPTRLAALFRGIPDLSCMKLSGEHTRQVRMLCDNAVYEVTSTRFGTNAAANARMMLSVYGELAEGAALLREDEKLAAEIVSERQKSPNIAIKDLAIGGKDLLSEKMEPKKIGAILSALLLRVIENPTLNERETLFALAKALTDPNLNE